MTTLVPGTPGWENRMTPGMDNIERSANGAPLQIVPPPIVHDEEEWAIDPTRPIPIGYVEESYRRLLVAAEGIDADREGVRDTPGRAARAWADLTAGYRVDPASLFTTFESEGYEELVLVKSIPFYSLCEHHLLPFHGHAHVAYIPGDRIVGLSKLARLVECFARRLQVQERMTAQIADTMVAGLNPRGVAVVVEAEHLCMAMRGVQKPGSSTVTSAVRGVMFDLPEARAEVLALLRDR